MNSIYTRRSVRQYSGKAVEAEKVTQIIKAAMQAPSAMKQMPWEFLVVRGADRLASLSEYHQYAGCLKGADLAIIVLGNSERFKSPTRWEQDLGAATQNLLIEAADIGLGAVWLGCAPDETKMAFVRDMFGLKENILPYAVIAVGYPADEGANNFVDRFDESRISYIG